MIGLITTIFQGPEQLLRQAILYLSNLATVAASGINLSDYLSWLGVLDGAWQGTVDSLLASFSLVAILFVTRSAYRAYLSLKQGVKWW